MSAPAPTPTGTLADLDGTAAYCGALLLEALFPHDAYRAEVERVVVDVAQQVDHDVLVRLIHAVEHCRTRVSAMPLLGTELEKLLRRETAGSR